VSRTGAGTFVAEAAPERRIQLRDLVDARVKRAHAGHAASQAINLSISRPVPLQELLQDAIAASADAIGPLAESVEYAPQGLPELRRLIADA
jgi:aspartate/methionine/tyrosine aminotransferase